MVQVECPWCGEGMALDVPALPAELRCGECATAIDVADAAAVEHDPLAGEDLHGLAVEAEVDRLDRRKLRQRVDDLG